LTQPHAQDEFLATAVKKECQILYLLARFPLLECRETIPFVLGEGFFDSRLKLRSILLLQQSVCQQICDLLHGYVGIADSYSEKQFFIQLRRDIFNRRELKDTIPSHPFIDSNIELKKLIKDYQQLLNKGQQFKNTISAFWKKSLEVAILHMSKLLKTNMLLVDGIRIANPELAHQIKEELFKCFSSKKSRHQLERLSSFILRAAYRTTPFATFAYTACIESIADINAICKPNINGHNQSHVFDMRLVRRAWLELIEDSKFIRQLKVSLNPFLFTSNGNLVFTNSFQNNQTVLIKQPFSNSVIKFISLFDDSILIESLLKKLSNNHEDLLIQIKGYLKKGVLVVSEQLASNPIEDLRLRLKNQNSDLALKWIATLNGSSSKDTASNSKDAAFPHVYKDLASLKPALIPTHHYQDAEIAFKRWCKRTIGLSWVKAENNILHAYFERAFPNRDSSSLPEFFRSFLSNPPSKEQSSILNDIILWRKQLLENIERIYLEKNGCLQDEDLAFLNFQESRAYPLSLAAQILPTQENAWVLPYGAYQHGLGRGCSRFLDLHPSLLKRLRARYSNIDNVIMAELRSPEFFSGNIYPPIFKHGIYLPDQIIRKEKNVESILWTDLIVTKTEKGTLQLTNSAGQLVIPIDLGFLDFRQRHPLYRLLNCFGPFERFTLQLPWGNPNGSQVESRPRLIFEDHLILARKTWRVPLKALKFSKKNEKDCDSAERLLDWAEGHQIPIEGFFRLLDPSHAAFLRPVQRKNILASSVLHRQEKPQYYNFANPFVVKRWRALMNALQEEKLPVLLEMQELLPHSSICELLVYLEAQ
jgi:hypothetical protein